MTKICADCGQTFPVPHRGYGSIKRCPTCQPVFKMNRSNRLTSTRYAMLKYKAKTCGVELGISFDQFVALIAQPCDYCGRPLAATGYGLDRKTPGGPFTLDNVVPCCGSCNELRGAHMTYDEAKERLPFMAGTRKHG